MPVLTVKNQNIKLVDFLSENLFISKNKAKKLVDSREVFVNNQRVWIASYILNRGDVVEYRDIFSFERGKIDIIYEDDFIIVVNKPPFIVTNEEENSVESFLRKEKGFESIRAIHRIDKETSGLVLFAKNNEVFEAYRKLWMKKEVKKVYLAISCGEAKFKEKRIVTPVDGKFALSLVKVVKIKNDFSMFEVEIKTGRKHQIRKHLASIGHPVVGDKEYYRGKIENDIVRSVPRQLLHSYKIEFYCPFTGKPKKFFSPVPEDFNKFFSKI
jgi:RluA family pseudouridine synthase